MLNLEIAICESDQGYAKKLSSYLMSNVYHVISVQVFSNETFLLEFLNNNSIDILLITEKMYLNLQNKTNVKSVMILAEHYINCGLLDLPYIEKFQQGKNILNKIITYYTSNSNRELVSKEDKKTELIGIYSPLGGCGKTTISIAIANTLSFQGGNTLFMSLEEIPSYSLLFDKTLESSMSDLFYHVKKKTSNLLMKMEGIQRIDYSTGLKYVPPPLYFEDIINFEEEYWEHLINYLLETNYYDYIVLDFTSNLSKRNKLLLEKCNKEILITNHSNINNSKLTTYLELCNKNMNRKENIILVYNDNNQNKSEIKEKINEAGTICEVPYSKDLYISKGEKISINLDNAFGKSIRKLIKVINING